MDFGLDIEGGMPLALLRGAAVASLLAVGGTLLVRAVIAAPVLARAEPAQAIRIDRRLRALAWVSLGLHALAGLAWLLIETSVLGDAESLTAIVDTLPVVLGDTLFGHLLLLRFALLAATAVLLARCGTRAWPPSLPAMVAVALQAGHSHAASMTGGLNPLLVSQALHVLAAAAWLGALPGLLVVIGSAPIPIAAAACRRFFPLGLAAVVVIIATASFQFWRLIGGLPALIGTQAGHMATLKILLFLLLLGIALHNRLRLAPVLSDCMSRSRLVRSIAFETACGLALVLVASTLASLPPARSAVPVLPGWWPAALDSAK